MKVKVSHIIEDHAYDDSRWYYGCACGEAIDNWSQYAAHLADVLEQWTNKGEFSDWYDGDGAGDLAVGGDNADWVDDPVNKA